VNKEEYLVLAATSGSDIALNKKVLAANEILKFIRRGELLSVAHLHGFDAEVVEILAAPDSPITRIPLSKIDPVFSRQDSCRRCLPGRTVANRRGRHPYSSRRTRDRDLQIPAPQRCARTLFLDQSITGI
jgi:Trk K+ transport system NAD-binding subunit